MYSIEDVNSRTILQQFHALYEKQKETNETVEEIQTDLAQEIQDRTNADSELADSISSLQNQLDSLGTIFTLKGSVATVGDLPQTDNHVGNVYYVVSESTGYIWIDDNGTERWEQLGISVDLSNYVTNDDLSTALADKQNKLTAGTNVSIIGDTISATQPDTTKFEMLSGVSAPSTATIGSLGQKYLDTTKSDIYVCTAVIDNGDDTFSYTWLLTGGNGKQNKLTAGTNITISGDVISASGGITNVKASDIDSESATQGQVLTANGSGGASFANVPAVTLSNIIQAFDNNKTLLLSRGNKFYFAANSLYQSYIQFEVDNLQADLSNTIKMRRIGSYGQLILKNAYIDSSNDILVIFPEKSGQLAVLNDVPRYIHTITIEQSGNKCEFEIISKSNTAFTYSTLATYLSSNYSITNSKLCSGIISGMTGVYPQHIWFDTTLNLISANGGGNVITFAEAGATVTDHVVTI